VPSIAYFCRSTSVAASFCQTGPHFQVDLIRFFSAKSGAAIGGSLNAVVSARKITSELSEWMDAVRFGDVSRQLV